MKKIFTNTPLFGSVSHIPSSRRVSVRDIGRFFMLRTTTLRGDERGVNGFTLIELLVVVLIIGILAAVALPQYERAVVKARVGTMLSAVGSIAAAEEVYYLVNGSYASNLQLLDVEMPASCTPIEGSNNQYYSCGKYFTLGIDPQGSVNLNYCPNHNSSWNECGTYWDFHIPFRLAHYDTDPGIRKCAVKNNSKLGKAVCANMAGFVCVGC